MHPYTCLNLVSLNLANSKGKESAGALSDPGSDDYSVMPFSFPTSRVFFSLQVSSHEWRLNNGESTGERRTVTCMYFQGG